MAFGVFDLLHPGHHYFLRQCSLVASARRLPLVVVVTRDHVVNTLKNKYPVHIESTRIANVRSFVALVDPATTVIYGDNVLGSYTIFDTYKPVKICCGYDQHGLSKDLKSRRPDLETQYIGAFEPHNYSSTIMRAKLTSTLLEIDTK